MVPYCEVTPLRDTIQRHPSKEGLLLAEITYKIVALVVVVAASFDIPAVGPRCEISASGLKNQETRTKASPPAAAPSPGVLLLLCHPVDQPIYCP